MAEDLLGFPELVGIGCIEEVAAGSLVRIEHAPGFIGLGAVPPARTEVARAKHELRDAKASMLAQNAISHDVLP
jgi:hypothetical protein